MKYDFSILITSYNQYSYIEQCINSLIHQSNVTYEIIISDDHSTDGTVDIIQKLISNISSIPITFIQHDVNIGMLKNMKHALDCCKGEYIAFCEGDDYWSDNLKLYKIKNLFNKYPKAVFCFTNIELDIEGKIHRHLESIKENLQPGYIGISDVCLPTNLVANFSCCAYRREVFKYVPASYWDSGEPNADLLLHLYILDQHQGIYLSDVCSRYRIRSNSSWSWSSQKATVYESINNVHRL